MPDAVIQVENLSKQYDAVQAVNSISFEVERNSTCALLGGNGAGKTTTIAMLLGLLLPSSGSVRILDEDILRHRYRVLPRMNFSSPYVDLPQRLTVAENLTVYAKLYGMRHIRARVHSLAEELAIEPFLRRPYRSLSAGQRTRVALAKALLNEPEVLLLDEPTASLDPDTADRMRGILKDYQRRSGATLLLASHNMSEVERLCDQVIMLRAGHIVDTGAPHELIRRYGRQDMEEVFLDIARGLRSGEVTV
ncbi:MAG: ABC transporter ATP-binding protein [Candidatus Competibacteraceae bacterium]|jgi:ABC-2 type transport system ATP-binding protein|nr:ABC transporter ATP-binding protein [Candidatus Competibacteraceae bacterium]